jgi:hypothetical protein
MNQKGSYDAGVELCKTSPAFYTLVCNNTAEKKVYLNNIQCKKPMKNFFVILLIILIVALLAIVAGMYVYENKKVDQVTKERAEMPTITNEASEPSQPVQFIVNSVTPTKTTIDSSVTIHGQGFSTISRVNFYNTDILKDGGVVGSILNPDYISPDGTEIRFKITKDFFVNGLKAKAGIFQIAVANIDCGNGFDLKCATNITSDKFDLEIISN